MADELIGTVIDQYRLFTLLAEGPLARVYLGWQASVDRTVAVKVYPQRPARNRKFLDDFRREAAIIARLEHRNIMPVYSFGEYERMPFVVSRYYEGGSLDQLIARDGALPPSNVARIINQVSEALGFAHHHGTVHRNVRPGNAHLGLTGNVYLGDFNIDVIRQTLGGQIVRAPEYSTDGPAMASEDIYALAAMAYEMLCGQAVALPQQTDDVAENVFVEGVSTYATLDVNAITDVEQLDWGPQVADVNPQIPTEISHVVAKALARDTAIRFSSPRAFAAALQRAVDGAGLGQVKGLNIVANEMESYPTMTSYAADGTVPGVRTGGLKALLIVGIVALLSVAIVVGVFVVLPSLNRDDEQTAANVSTTEVKAATDSPLPTTASTELPVSTNTLEGAEATIEPTEVIPTETPVPALLAEIDSFGNPMVLVPAGTFLMGDEAKPDQRPVHQVTLDAFYIDKYEVRNGEFLACIQDGECNRHDQTTAPSIFGYFGTDFYAEYAVIYMSWEDAVDYCDWREARLPTEAEWEKAARWDPETGETRNYPWGNEFPNITLLNFFGAGGQPVQVTSFPDSASAVGALNMAGNVLEWVADWYDADYYDVSPSENPQGPATGQFKVLRGGSFDTTSGGIIASTRFPFATKSTDNDFGIRCAMSPPGS